MTVRMGRKLAELAATVVGETLSASWLGGSRRTTRRAPTRSASAWSSPRSG